MKFVASLILSGAVAACLCGSSPGRVGAAQVASGQSVVEGQNAFAFDLYAHLHAQKGNLFFSPYSVSTALAMTSAGARGDTAAEMAKTLHFPADADALHAGTVAQLQRLKAVGERGNRFLIANALWGQKGHPFRQPFLDLVRTRYQSGFSELNFSEPEAARNAINAWVAKQTQDRIVDLLPQGSIDGETRLVLTNAIYFKGAWDSPFAKKATTPGPFAVGAGQTVRVPMLHQTGRFDYFESDRLQAVELPYHGKELSMVVLLPKTAGGLADLEKALTPGTLKYWLGGMLNTRVDLSLPRFRTSGRFPLAKTLAAMGMPRAFAGGADFSGMDGSRGLRIADVHHQAFVDVNEEVTEAAAATGVVMTKNLGARRVAVPFHADRPFVFLIRDVRSGAVLFIGRVTDPR